MNRMDYKKDWYDIDQSTYDWSVKAFRSFKKMLHVNLKLHVGEQVNQGDIFLFNHFSRFETFIPQYLIYEKTGAYCWSIASSEFFQEDTVLAKYLRTLGVMPHDHPHLFPILAKQMLRGHKVIIFPEGGMVKDRQVMDEQGHFSVLSQMTGVRRKHHTGAAVLAQGLEAFKATIRNAYRNKDIDKLQGWKQELEFENIDQLLLAAVKPTLIIPSNITFYPIRSSDNLLLKSVELFADGLSRRLTEELLVEGNIMFKHTDMDIRMGEPIDPYSVWHRWNDSLLEMVASEFNTLDEIFALHNNPKNWKQKLLGFYFKKNAEATRNQYMRDIYTNVTINLSHLASTLIMHCISIGKRQIDRQVFYRTLYIAIKILQQNTDIKLHRNLLNPDYYNDLIRGKNKRFEQFIKVAENSGLLNSGGQNFYFDEKLDAEYSALTIRMENLIAVYHNEAIPIKAVGKAIIKALAKAQKHKPEKMAEYLLEDEVLSLQLDRNLFIQTCYDEINQKEQASADSTPFLYRPKHSNGYGVLLIHGLLASPAEVSAYGANLVEKGYTVMGVRVKGHGTSPHDLRTRTTEDWSASVENGGSILQYLCAQIMVIGFSTGGALALQYSAKNVHVIAVVAVAVPISFVDPSLMMVPLLHGTNKLVQWFSSYEGVKPFIENEPENPEINYRAIPVRSLYELRRLIHQMEANLGDIKVPTLLVYADQDPIVASSSANHIMEKLTNPHKELKVVQANQHGILKQNLGNTWRNIDQFLEQICQQQE